MFVCVCNCVCSLSVSTKQVQIKESAAKMRAFWRRKWTLKMHLGKTSCWFKLERCGAVSLLNLWIELDACCLATVAGFVFNRLLLIDSYRLCTICQFQIILIIVKMHHGLDCHFTLGFRIFVMQKNLCFALILACITSTSLFCFV